MIKRIDINPKKEAPFCLIPNNMDEELIILWNTGVLSNVRLDGFKVAVGTNCILFVSEIFTKLEVVTGTFRIIKFNKIFINPVDSLVNIGEYLMIFYGLHAVNNLPKIVLFDKDLALFESIWQDLLLEERNISNPISGALLLNSFQRFLLLSQKKHMENAFDIPMNLNDLKLIREFQYLVNIHYKDLTKVSDYANILKVSPKKIAQTFACCYNKKASELIADRRNVFAKRQLLHTDKLIKNIAYELNFSDSQTFSHFFKKQNGESPLEFREKMKVKEK